jgi:hypothetical protein
MFISNDQLIGNPDRTKEAAIILYEKFNSNEGIFGNNIMPEDQLPKINTSSDLTIDRGSYDHRLLITMVVSIDYQRDAGKLWEAGRDTFEDERTRWLFYPSELTKRTQDEIVSAMQVHKLSKKPEQDAEIWAKVSRSFFKYYDADPINLIKKYNHDALSLYNKKLDYFFKKDFPFLSGDKIFPLWIRMMHDNVGIDFKNLDKIPIPIDIHTCRASFNIGVLSGKYLGAIPDVKNSLNRTWEKVIMLIYHPKLTYPLQMDEPLWHLSKYGCTFRNRNNCPVKNDCPVKNYCVNGIVEVSADRVRIETMV